jgi:hypothetical protein
MESRASIVTFFCVVKLRGMSYWITPLKTHKMNHRISSARLSTACTAFLLTLCLNAFAQKTVVWKGGTPGQETNWYCAKNWSTQTNMSHPEF